MHLGSDTRATDHPRKRKLGRKLLLLMATTVLTLAVLELVFRVVGVTKNELQFRVDKVINIPGMASKEVPYGFPTHTIFISRYSSDPRGYFEQGNSMSHRHNSAGWRDVEHTQEKPANVFRILGLGDSYLWGQGVKRGDICLTKLPALLQDAIPNRTIETINAAMPAMNTHDQRNQLEMRGLAYDPDLVIVHFVLNDVEEDLSRRGPKVEFFEEYKVVSGSTDWLSGYSSLWRWVRQGTINYVRGRQYVQECVDSFSTANPGWRKCRVALRDVKAMCDGYGIRLCVVIFPFYYELNGDYPFEPIHEIVAEYCVSQEIPVLDLRHAYREFRGPELWVHPTDQHPNEIAHEIAAKAIVAYLIEHGETLLRPSNK